MTDLVKRLRGLYKCMDAQGHTWEDSDNVLLREAADEIERLRGAGTQLKVTNGLTDALEESVNSLIKSQEAQLHRRQADVRRMQAEVNRLRNSLAAHDDRIIAAWMAHEKSKRPDTPQAEQPRDDPELLTEDPDHGDDA